MDTEKVLYSITIEDVINVSEEIKIEFAEDDISFIQDKISDFLGSEWFDAIEFALRELEEEREK
jgi:hypothetical protein